MSVYKKLQDARIELQGKVLKKSGLNKFANFQYFELGDFLPEVQTIFHKHGLSSTINFHAAEAVLLIVDVEDNTSAIFSCPVVVPTMKGCNEVQALGAMITYIRRYLYVNALEIVEHDAMDAVVGKEEKIDAKAEYEDWLAEKVNLMDMDGNLDPAIEAEAWKKKSSKVRSAIKAYGTSIKENQ